MVRRGIHDGDVVWVNPDREAQVGRVVVARLWASPDEEVGLVVKVLRSANELWSEGKSGDLVVSGHHFEVLGPAVWVESGRPPG